jgi:drug/metabolite transporter (DMT)-like permease
MLYLIGFMLTAVCSTHGMRFAQGRGCRMAWVGVWLFVAAGVTSSIWTLALGLPIPTEAITYGLAGGVCLSATYLVFTVCIRLFGVGVAHLVRAISLAIPVLACIIVWHEKVGILRGIGLGLVFVTLPLLGKPNATSSARKHRHYEWMLLVALFVLSGLTNVIFKAYCQFNIADGAIPYTIFLFLGATIGSLVAGFGSGARSQWKDFGYGAIIGLVNVLLNFCRLTALTTEDGVRAFPTMYLGGLVLSIIVAVLVWKERFRGRTLIGVILALVVLVLIRLF